MLTMPEIQYDSVELLNRKECVVIIYYVIWCTVFQHCDHFLAVHSKFCSLINFKLINLLIYYFGLCFIYFSASSKIKIFIEHLFYLKTIVFIMYALLLLLLLCVSLFLY